MTAPGTIGTRTLAAPVEAALLVLHVADHPGVRAETELPAATQEQTVDAIQPG